MKRCRHCRNEFQPSWCENRSEYCKTCRDSGIPKRYNNKRMRIKRMNKKTLGKIKGYMIGNPGQDNDILRFLHD